MYAVGMGENISSTVFEPHSNVDARTETNADMDICSAEEKAGEDGPGRLLDEPMYALSTLTSAGTLAASIGERGGA